jgi:hypothetical protein
MRRSGGRPELRSISYFDASRKVAVLACLVGQTGGTPFNPRHAVKKFAGVLGEFGVSRVGLHSLVTASTAHIDETQVADVPFAREILPARHNGRHHLVSEGATASDLSVRRQIPLGNGV